MSRNILFGSASLMLLSLASCPAIAGTLHDMKSNVSALKQGAPSRCDEVADMSMRDTSLVSVDSIQHRNSPKIVHSSKLTLVRIQRSKGPCGDRIFGVRGDSIKFDNGVTIANQHGNYKWNVLENFFAFPSSRTRPDIKGAQFVVASRIIVPSQTPSQVGHQYIGIWKTASKWNVYQFREGGNVDASEPVLLISSDQRIKSATYRYVRTDFDSEMYAEINLTVESGSDLVIFSYGWIHR